MEQAMVMESNGADMMAMGVKCAENLVTKSSLDNIVGNLWQQRQESSGSSVGNQSPHHGEDLSDGEPGSPAELSVRNSTPEVAEMSHERKREESGRDSGRDSGNDAGSGEADSEGCGGVGGGGERDRGGGGGGGVRVKDPRDLIVEKEDRLDVEKDHAHQQHHALMAGFPALPALEALSKQHQNILNSQHFLQGLRTPPSSLFPPHSMAGGLGGGPPPGLNFPPLTRPPSQPPTPSSQRSNSPLNGSGGAFGGSQQNWSFEEQFKQLYEIDDNPRRKEFLDELFTYMQKRGTPINRLPIMAKQVLDLYELFNLVIARGGLVEVINKKLWQEVIKGLGLPSSITSAAFTLRTQYTKYLYPLECKKQNLSHPTDLQVAIEGNKREGRRSSYGAFPDIMPPMSVAGMSPMSPMSALMAGHQPGMPRPNPFSNGGIHHPQFPPKPMSPPSKYGQDPIAALEMTRLALLKMYNQHATNGNVNGNNNKDLSSPSASPRPPLLPPLPPTFPLGGVVTSTAAGMPVSLPSTPSLPRELFAAGSPRKRTHEDDKENIERETAPRNAVGAAEATPPAEKRAHVAAAADEEDEPVEVEQEEEEEDLIVETEEKRATPPTTNDVVDMSEAQKNIKSALGMFPGANIKITNRGDSKHGDGAVVVSMEINGMSYQGVLFAQPIAKSNAAKEAAEA